MIMRITWGKLNPGTWDEFERVYKETLAGKEIKGLRGRWLAQMRTIPTVAFPSACGKPQRTCKRMSKARCFGTCTLQPCARFLLASTRPIVVR